MGNFVKELTKATATSLETTEILNYTENYKTWAWRQSSSWWYVPPSIEQNAVAATDNFLVVTEERRVIFVYCFLQSLDAIYDHSTDFPQVLAPSEYVKEEEEEEEHRLTFSKNA